MSVFTGAQGRGAMRAHRTRKREEAAARDAALSIGSPRRRSVRATIDHLERAFLEDTPRETGSVDLVTSAVVVFTGLWLATFATALFLILTSTGR